jgi:ribosome-binding factor A
VSTENKRQLQVGRLIQKDLGEIFRKDLKSVLGNSFVTITDVKVSPDLSIARVYLSFMMVNDKEALLETIRENTKKIRGLFGNRARNQLRIVPDFQFYIDDTAEYAQKMNELFSKLDIPPADDSELDESIYTR